MKNLVNWGAIERFRQRQVFRVGFLLFLMVGLALATLIAISSGTEIDYSVTPPETVAKHYEWRRVADVSLDAFSETRLARQLGIEYDSGLDYQARCGRGEACPLADKLFINEINWPRVLMALLIGAGLGIAGAALQGTFRNPLADPSLIGVSGGAAMGAATAIWQDIDAGVLLRSLPDIPTIGVNFSALDGAQFAQALAAFAGGLVMTFLVYRLARFAGRTDVTTLLLVGLAVNAIAAAYIGMVISVVGREKVGDINAWTLGGVSGTFWRDVYTVFPFLVVSIMLLPFWARQLNLMALGEADARHLGVHTERLRLIVIGLSAVIVGVAVAFAGIIAFVGLMVPQLIRLWAGPDHRILLPASALGGGIFLILADLFARTVVLPGEVPLGSVTTLVGGPFFLFLVFFYRSRGKQS